MALDYAILGFVSSRPLSGYDVKTRCIDQESRHFWAADQAQVYRTLDRLAAAGLVASTRERQSGRPDRKVYRITPAGRDALSEWLARSGPLPPSKDQFLLQLQFASDLDDDSLARLLSEQRHAHQSRLEDIRTQIGELSRQRGPLARDLTLRRMALDGAAAAERAAIDWLDDCLEVTSRGLPGSPTAHPGTQSQLFPTRGTEGRR